MGRGMTGIPSENRGQHWVHQRCTPRTGRVLLLLMHLCVIPLGSVDICASARPLSSSIRSRARLLHKTWGEMYGLNHTRSPPLQVTMPTEASGKPLVPWAPHLEECTAVSAMRRQLETAPEGSPPVYPKWSCAREQNIHSGIPLESHLEVKGREARGEEEEEAGEGGQQRHDGGGTSFCDNPRPPWVKGAEEDNLPLTHRVQRDLFIHQFPLNCSLPNQRFLLVGWKSHLGHGLGAQLHIMSVALSIAVSTNRILVPLPGSFRRADHDGCQGTNAKGSLECYFFPLTSNECTQRALSMKASQGPTPEKLRHRNPKAVANSTLPVVVIRSTYVWTAFKFEASAAEAWGTPWVGRMAPFELLGSTLPNYDSKMAQVNWWRSQSIRFMLRWPSAYLCHLTNRARHEAYGLRVALRIAATEDARMSIETSKEGFIKANEASILSRRSLSARKGGVPLERTPEWRFPAEPYMLGPIISMHVRQGDKAKEMKLFSLPSFMWLANRVRLHVPDVHYIWLSSEMQSVIDDSSRYSDWTFLYTRIKRQVGSTAFNSYEKDAGMEQIAGSSFVNLVIASQCDYFVGTLGSNWNRLINELRETNGRLKASYMTLNNNDW